MTILQCMVFWPWFLETLSFDSWDDIEILKELNDPEDKDKDTSELSEIVQQQHDIIQKYRQRIADIQTNKPKQRFSRLTRLDIHCGLTTVKRCSKLNMVKGRLFNLNSPCKSLDIILSSTWIFFSNTVQITT